MNFRNVYLLAYSTVQISSKDPECYILEQFSYMHIYNISLSSMHTLYSCVTSFAWKYGGYLACKVAQLEHLCYMNPAVEMNPNVKILRKYSLYGYSSCYSPST